jgi:superfamily I DNA and RNA helicase
MSKTVERESIFLEQDLSNLETKIRTLFPANQVLDKITVAKLQNILSPSFTVLVRLDKQIEEFNRQAERLLTAEQERILDETELDSRKTFFGSAGTGKTFLAMEKANRLAAENQKVLLTCFNKNLAAYMRKSFTSPKITVANFHDFLLRTLQKQDPKLNKFTLPYQTIR